MDITTFTATVAEFFHQPDWYHNWVLQVFVVIFLTLLLNLQSALLTLEQAVREPPYTLSVTNS